MTPARRKYLNSCTEKERMTRELLNLHKNILRAEKQEATAAKNKDNYGLLKRRIKKRKIMVAALKTQLPPWTIDCLVVPMKFVDKILKITPVEIRIE